jgi:uncharacterized protein YegJ (DUF2314 family)
MRLAIGFILAIVIVALTGVNPLCGTLACAASWSTAAAQQDRVIQVPIEDRDMQEAMASARKSLDQFWAAFEAKQSSDEGFALKVAITDGSKVEHFWVNRLQRRGAVTSGIVNNDPNDVTTVKLGQRIDFPVEQISDWMFLRDGKIVGNATLRVLLKYMPKEQAEHYRSMLATER